MKAEVPEASCTPPGPDPSCGKHKECLGFFIMMVIILPPFMCQCRC